MKPPPQHQQQKELVLIPAPGIGHLVSMAEFSKRLLDRDDHESSRLSITVLIMAASVNPEIQEYSNSLSASDTRIRYLSLPLVDPPPPELLRCPEHYVSLLIESYKSHVKDAILKHVLSSSSRPQLAGIVIDLFCTSMMDVANELSVPSYLFFTSGAAFLGFMLYLSTHHERVGRLFTLSDPDNLVFTYAHPLPSSVLPACTFNAEGYACFLNHGVRFRETKGFIINTFAELEPYAVQKLSSDKETPPVYAVGPLLDLGKMKKGSGSESEEIIQWLDMQPEKSVVFLCFGSMGGFEPPQIMEMAKGLERSGYRFLWSVRKPRAKGKEEYYRNGNKFHNLEEIFPLGFLERTRGRGMLCGWAPQVEVLAHRAVGGFVSHCGWNSTLESLWHGVPMATLPIYAEQQLNAFELVKELGLAVELRLDYSVVAASKGEMIVSAEEIERALRGLMEEEEGVVVRERVEEMKEKCRKAVSHGGSSFQAMGCFIHEIISEK